MRPGWIGALRQALLAGGVALLLFGPLSGVALQGYDFRAVPEAPWLLAAAVFCGRLLYLLGAETILGAALLRRLTLPPVTRVSSPGRDRRRRLLAWGIFAAAVIGPFLLFNPWYQHPNLNYLLKVAILTLIYVLLGLGLNIVVGLAGLLDLGYVAFYAVGAYAYALGHQYWGLSFWEAIPLGAALAGMAGVALAFPVLRMHGDYLAIVTLGFGEIIRLILNNWLAFTGGPNGVRAPHPTFFGLEFARVGKEGALTFHEYLGLPYSPVHRYFYIYLALMAVTGALAVTAIRLKQMPIGRAWEALREDEIACRSLGINHVMVKLSAFGLGAMAGGIGGVFFAGSQGFVSPTSFTFIESAHILAIVVLGGMGSITGVTAAAAALTILPELLRNFSDYRMLIFGLVMVVMMIWRPGGFSTPQRRGYPVEPGHVPA
ncbi:MAG: high-affinity branched-chain amino acid ABC transporter permease LivM [Magnetococcales bacterium]|nr:high-affinity branched-chain amino acid ABC transporter permease LivM [Magnetococcales bacterium]